MTADDGCWYYGGASQPVFLGSHPAVGALNSWFRFGRNWDFIKGATINSAVLRLKATANETSEGIVESTHFADEDSSAAIASATDGDSRSKTAGETWNIGNWTANNNVDSPDLASVLQPIADRPGLSGAIQVFVMNTAGSSATRLPFDRQGGEANAAKLVVNDTPAETPTANSHWLGGTGAIGMNAQKLDYLN